MGEPPTLPGRQVTIGNNPWARLMVRVAPRSYSRDNRGPAGFLLLSVMLHLLFIVALSLPLRPWELLHREAEEEQREPILVSLVRPENTEEPAKAQVLAETSSRAKHRKAQKSMSPGQTGQFCPKSNSHQPNQLPLPRLRCLNNPNLKSCRHRFSQRPNPLRRHHPSAHQPPLGAKSRPNRRRRSLQNHSAHLLSRLKPKRLRQDPRARGRESFPPGTGAGYCRTL